jgi:hypothetical protein
MHVILTAKRSITVLLSLLVVATMIATSCSDRTSRVIKKTAIDVPYTPDTTDMEPLHVPVATASDQWWFRDNYTFLGRFRDVGNFIFAADIDRCLDPANETRITKSVDCRFFNSQDWSVFAHYSIEDSVSELAHISVDSRMSYFESDDRTKGSFSLRFAGDRTATADYIQMGPYYCLTDDKSFKHVFSSGKGRLQIGDSVWTGIMFHEMLNVRGNNGCTGETPSFEPSNYFRLYAGTAAGKTIIASIDDNKYTAHNNFFAICDPLECKMGQGDIGMTNLNTDFRKVDGYDGFLPHFVDIFSGDSLNVRMQVWVDKDRYDVLDNGYVRSGFFGNCVFWNRREKTWGVMEHYQPPSADTIDLIGYRPPNSP